MSKALNNNKILIVVSDLKRVGPTNQTLNLINYSKYKDVISVITLFDEPSDTMIEEYKKNNISISSLKLNRFFYVNKAIKKIRNLINENDIKIIHSYGIKSDYICHKAVKKTKATHMLTLRNFPLEDIFTRMNFFSAIIAYNMHMYALLNTKHIIACSNTIKNKMIEKYPNMNIKTIQNGVDIEKFYKCTVEEKKRLREKYNIDQNKIIFISTSSFIARKRIQETIEAFEKINLNNKLLLLLGTGNEYNKIYNNYCKNKDIIFVGKTDKVLEYLQLSDIFVSSSESEGLPNGVIEAIAVTLPVLLSDIPQHKEVLNEIKSAGITYELGNIQNYSDKMIEILSFNNKKCNIMTSNLTMKNMSNKYYKYYEEIIQGK